MKHSADVRRERMSKDERLKTLALPGDEGKDKSTSVLCARKEIPNDLSIFPKLWARERENQSIVSAWAASLSRRTETRSNVWEVSSDVNKNMHIFIKLFARG